MSIRKWKYAVSLLVALVCSEFILADVSSANRSVDVYQDGTCTSDVYIRILYDLLPVVGNDGLTYRPVDMGAGVAWANKNVGAADSTQTGSYFYWGGTEAITSVATTQYYAAIADVGNTASEAVEQNALPLEADAANVVMGSRWRMPTLTEMKALMNTTSYVTFSSTGTEYNYYISNKYFPELTIFMPATGQMTTNNSAAVGARAGVYLLTSVQKAYNSSKKYESTIWNLSNQGLENNKRYAWYGMPIRAVYVPEFETCTLTAETYEDGVKKATYTYICEKGQTVSITGIESEGFVLSEWKADAMDGAQLSTEPSLTLTVSEDMTVCASFVPNEYGVSVSTAVAPYHSGEVKGGGTFHVGKHTTLTATPAEHYTFARWQDGNTDNPRTITVGGETTYTAYFVLDDVEPASPLAKVEVFQSGVKEGIKILYDLPEADENGYQPIDVGSGIAWANKNVGAETTEDYGLYYYWGGTEAKTLIADAAYWDGLFAMPTTTATAAVQYALPQEADVARAEMGNRWRMPTIAEVSLMIDGTTGVNNGDGYVHTNNIDTAKHVFIPAAGYHKNKSGTAITAGTFLWASTINSITANGYQSLPGYYINGSFNLGATYQANYAMPVRGVYVPPFEVCSLTINIGEHTYYYMCEYGQQVTVTAYATADGNVFTSWTNEDGDIVSEDITHTFFITRDAVYTANIATTGDDTYMLTTVSSPLTGGDIVGGGTFLSGKTAVLTAEPYEGFTFTRWSDGNTDNPRSVLMDDNKTLTAVFTVDPSLVSGITSQPASAALFEDGTDKGIEIKYHLPYADNGYRVVDLGSGVAWANKNVDATDSTKAGSYFAWGSIEPMETYNASMANPFTDSPLAANNTLPSTHDAATQRIGSHWRTPTKDEWQSLISNSSWTGKTAFMVSNPNHPDRQIFLPNTGYIKGTTVVTDPLINYYWSATFNTWNAAWKSSKAYYNTAQTVTSAQICTYGIPVRAVYQPDFDVVTLTVNVYEGGYQDEQTLKGTYYYVCEKGQTLALTAYSTNNDYSLLKWTNDEEHTIAAEPTVSFLMLRDAEYNVYFNSGSGETTHIVSTECSPKSAGEVIGGGVYVQGRTTQLIATAAEHFRFTRWQDGNTDNPRTITVSDDATYTAEFAFESITPASETITKGVFQSGVGEGTEIEYKMQPTTVGGITYTPVDMGAGVAWADKNIGADTEEDGGLFFYWGGTEPVTSIATSAFYAGVTGMVATANNTAVQNALPASADAAMQMMNGTWRMPTCAELAWLKTPTTATRDGAAATGYTFTNNNDETKQIFIPAGGLIRSGSTITTGNTFLWGSTVKTIDATGYNSRPAFFFNGSYTAGGDITVSNSTWKPYEYWAMPVRAVYQPPFEVCTITVNTATDGETEHTYVYMCELGQSITLTAYATEDGNAFLNWTDEYGDIVSGDITHTFLVTGDATYTANISSEPENTVTLTTHTSPLTGGRVQGDGTFVRGKTALLTVIPDDDYTFTRWADGNTDNPRAVLMDESKTLTAVFTIQSSVTESVVSSAVSASIFADGTGEGYGIKYALPYADNGYRPVDVGSGVAWANKNIDAADSTQAGSYFFWGGTEPMSTYNASQANPFTANPVILPADNDAATQRIGSRWRTPTKDEWQSLIDNASWAGLSAYMVSNPNEPEQQIFLPNTGYKRTASSDAVTSPLVNYYWSATMGTWNATLSKCTVNYYTAQKVATMIATTGAPVRAVYQPDFDIVEITVKAYSDNVLKGTYYYECERGQQLTLNAYSADNEHPLQRWTNADGQTVETNPIVVLYATEDAEYNVYFAADEDAATAVITTECSPKSAGEVIGGGVYVSGKTTQLVATANEHFRFTRWQDGNTDNPRTITVSDDASYTAEFAFDATTPASAAVSKEVFQSGVGEGTEIEYKMQPTTVGGITYTPVDLGTGIAWADKNVNAAEAEDYGSYFYWGGTEPVTTAVSSAYYAGVTAMSSTTSKTAEQYPLPASADAATQLIGGTWRMPTASEANDLTTAAVGKGASNAAAAGYTYYNLNDENKSIYLPPAGYYPNATCTLKHTFFWASVVKTPTAAANTSLPFYYQNNAVKYTDKFYEYFSMPVRAVYQPTFEVCTVTVNVTTDGETEHTYVYMCELGQRITLTAYATEAGNAFVNWTDEYGDIVSGDITHTFLVTGDATYYANMTASPEDVVTLTLVSQPFSGGVIQRGSDTFIKGKTAVLTVTPAPDYTFTRWSDGNTDNPRSVLMNEDKTLTAEFALNLHATNSMYEADVFQSGVGAGMVIGYALPATDANGYYPIDLGAGVAWANKNVGADSPEDVGSYFYWGGTVAVTEVSTAAYYDGVSDMTSTTAYNVEQHPLPASADAATANMGSTWRMPTCEELYWLQLPSGATETGAAATGYTYTNNLDENKQIFIPAGGVIKSGSTVTAGTFLWGSTVKSINATAYNSLPAFYYNGAYSAGAAVNKVSYYSYFAMPVRAVYQPAFNTATLTVVVQTDGNTKTNQAYKYVCERGQSVRITAFATDDGNAFLNWTNENGEVISDSITKTFIVTGDSTYYANITSEPENTVTLTTVCSPFSGGVIQRGSDTFIKGKTAVLTVTPAPDYTFTRWSDGNTDNPRSVLMNEDKTLTAEFALNLHATNSMYEADVFQSGVGAGMVIGYALPATDANGYYPIDLGAGVAWANKNVGADSPEDVGSYFYWGGTVAVTEVSTAAYYDGVSDMTSTTAYNVEQHPLPASADAATANMGSTWRMPTCEELYWLQLPSGATETGAAATGYTYTNNLDENKQIFIPAGGVIKSGSTVTAGTFLWGSTVKSINATAYNSLPAFYYNGAYSAGAAVNKVSYYSYFAMPVRAVYQPAFNTATLTVVVQTDGNTKTNQAYKYVCERGQSVRITAFATDDGNAFLNWTNENGEVISDSITKTFIVTGDSTYYANIVSSPDNQHLLTTVALPMSGGDIQGGGTFISGKTAVLTVTPREGYTFAGWTDDNNDNPRRVKVTDDIILTARFTPDAEMLEGVTSDDAKATIYQDATGEGYIIKYALPSEESGYRIVDVGSGIAWANKNIGAADSTEAGYYFAWGGVERMTTYTVPANPFDAMPEDNTLPQANDAARQNISTYWRTPTRDEYNNLIGRCNWSGTSAYMVSNPNDENKCIFLPNTGYMKSGTTVSAPAVNYYWTATMNGYNAAYNKSTSFYYTAKTTKAADIVSSYGMPVRAVYQPAFETRTLIVNVYEGDFQGTQTLKGTYHYVCEKGQTLTLTAYSTDTDYPLQRWTNEQDQTVSVEPTVEVIVNEDAEYNVYFCSNTGLSTAVITALASPASGGVMTGGGVYVKGRTTTLVATPTEFFSFKRWSDGSTANPRTITVSDDATYTAVFEAGDRVAVSAAVSVEVFQSGVKEGTEIEYQLPAWSGDGYYAVDMGGGIAWANKNVGATDSLDAGDYFYWGGTEPVATAAAATYYGDITSMAVTTTIADNAQNPLPAVADAAVANMPDDCWRMPTLYELYEMTTRAPFDADVSDKTTGYLHVNALDPTKQIFIPSGGYKKAAAITAGNTLLWGSTVKTISAANSLPAFYLDGTYNAGAAVNKVSYLCWYGIPVRAVYVPPFPTCTLTINIGEHTYYYMCEIGQDITVTAYATEDGYAFQGWQDENGDIVSEDITHTFSVKGDATYTAVLLAEPEETYLLTTEVYPLGGGDIIGGGTFLTNGKTAVLTVVPREGFTFTRWADGSTDNPRSVNVVGDMTMTAIFTLDQLITNAVASPANTAIIWQDATGEGTYIRYLLKPDTLNKGTDSETIYRPVDMGFGVAWANKNVGAADSTQTGSYFFWGGTEAMETYNASQTYPDGTFAATAILPADYDAATQNIGSHWRTPLSTEWQNLQKAAYCTWVGRSSSMVYNKLDYDNHIFLPITGYMKTTDAATLTNPAYLYYWTANAYSATANAKYSYFNIDSNGKDSKGINNCSFRFGMPVRAVYVPPFEVCTLTVNVYEGNFQGAQTLKGTYTYLCEKGQSLTLTAYSTDTDYPLQRWTNSDDYTVSREPIVKFVVNEDADYNLYFAANTGLNTAVVTTMASPEIGGEVTGGGVYVQGATTTLTATPDHNYTFTRWSDGNTDNPRTITPTADITYTAEFTMKTVQSAHAYVDVYRTAENQGTTIEYFLPANVNGYRPVDMGAGIAWADRNVGAADSTDAGSYFYWGGTTPVTSASNADFWRGIMGMTTTANQNVAQNALPAANDAATQNMGERWRMPTCQDLYYLRLPSGTTRTGSAAEGYTYTNSISGEELFIPSGGFYKGEDITEGNTFLWGSTIGTINRTSGDISQCYNSLPAAMMNATSAASATFSKVNYPAWYAMPVRAVYEPPFDVYTITVIVKTGKTTNATYYFVCEYGQQLTVSAFPECGYTAANTYYFVNWTNAAGEEISTDATETFTVTEDATYIANFQNTADGFYTLTVNASPETAGTFIGSGRVAKDSHTKLVALPNENYVFSHWSDQPANTDSVRYVDVTSDMTLTAVFRSTVETDDVESSLAYADIYQAGTNAGTYIRYMLPGEDSNGYRPVDVGAGIAWANKNIGAADSTDVGDYFYWGGTTPVNTVSSSTYYEGVADMTVTASATAVQYPLPDNADAARVIMGANWRMPTAYELNQLNATGSTTNTRTGVAAQGYQYVQKEDPNQVMYIPSGGLYDVEEATEPTYGHTALWGSTTKTVADATSRPTYYYDGACKHGTAYKTVSKVDYFCNAWFAMPVRAVYEPSFETRTLTLQVYNGTTLKATYYYVCELGQQLTVTAHPTNSNTTAVASWQTPAGAVISTDPTYTFTVLEDATYCVYFTTAFDNPCTLTTVASPDESGEIDGAGIYEQGTTVLLTATPAEHYHFVHWEDMPANTDTKRYVTLSGDATYTAVFELDATKVGQASISQNASADTIAILYDLPTTFIGGIYYTPVDMGNGTAWADRNVGAVAAGDVGSYCSWGATAASTTFKSNAATQKAIANELATGYDFAYKLLGKSWRMPSKADWESLISTCPPVDNTFTNPFDPNSSITLPKAGIYAPTTTTAAELTEGCAGYWSRTIETKLTAETNYYYSQPWCYYNGSVTYGDDIPNGGYVSFGMPVRAVYVPQFTVCTLTVQYTDSEMQTHTNTYLCEQGQTIILSAYAAEGYEFNQWSDGNRERVRTLTVSRNQILTAEFNNANFILLDRQTDDYYDGIAATYYGDGSNPVNLTSITYNRTLQANQWNAISLPFSMELEGTELDGLIYEYKGATGNAQDGVYINFASATRIEAGVPYLIRPDRPITTLVFTPTDDTPELHFTDAITNDDGDALASYVDGGTVRFNATNRRFALPGETDPDWKTYIFLANNRLYYPHETGNTMPAFRGFFRVDGVGGVAPRIRIVVDNQTTTDIEPVEFEQAAMPDVRKYIQDGILIIERNGVPYNAQGSRMK